MLVLFVVETSAVVAEADAEAFVEGDSLVVAACTGCSESSAAPEDSVANKQSITTARDDSCIEQL